MKSLGRYRYGYTLALVTAVAILAVLAPDEQVSQASIAAMLGLILFVVTVTGNSGQTYKRSVGSVAVLVIPAIFVLTLFGNAGEWVPNALASVLIVATVIELVRGAVRMSRRQGVTGQTIAAGLAIYLLIGIFFVSVTGVAADLSDQPYFTDGREATLSERAYFSYTTMTTTGFGDPTAATRAGKSLAVLEMLIGQIYLVTVIALLVSRARRPDAPPERPVE
ncbi:MAG TPA: potassium channel family protein [Solirubrobacterales bacterium]|nr:potassium channel family protein [Solirubrobacterales bacterium]